MFARYLFTFHVLHAYAVVTFIMPLVQATIPLMALSCWCMGYLPHPIQILAASLFYTQGSSHLANCSINFTPPAFNPHPVTACSACLRLSNSETYNASRCTAIITGFTLGSARNLMGLQQRGGGRGRPRKIPISTPKGVQKSQPLLSESGHHRRTTYKRGDVEAVFREKIPSTTASESTKRTIRERNHRNKADLMSLFNEVSGASAEKDMAQLLKRLPKGATLMSPPLETHRHIDAIFVGFGLTIQFHKEKLMDNWSTKERKAANK
jgi:hypothetical protein